MNNRSKLQDIVEASELLQRIWDELGLTNVKCFGFYRNKWVIKYKKGRQDKFETFAEMYEFLKTEGL